MSFVGLTGQFKRTTIWALILLLLFITAGLLIELPENLTGEFVKTTEEATTQPMPTTTQSTIATTTTTITTATTTTITTIEEALKNIYPKTLTQQLCPIALKSYLQDDEVEVECYTDGFECMAISEAAGDTYCHAGYDEYGSRFVEIYAKVDYGLGYPVKKLLKEYKI